MEVARHTFLFTDLVGFTALTATEGDDRAAEVALDFYRRVRSLLPEHSAEEVKTIGDGIMIRCDEPALAVKLGLRIVTELAEVEGFPPVRVGMHTGAAVERDGDWYGATVNVAARLCAAAGGGEVLVSDSVMEEISEDDHLEFENIGQVKLKGFDEPRRLCRVRARE